MCEGVRRLRVQGSILWSALRAGEQQPGHHLDHRLGRWSALLCRVASRLLVANSPLQSQIEETIYRTINELKETTNDQAV